MNAWIVAGVLAAGYLLGSIPFGLLVVRFSTGQDLRAVESGRTGGTNAMRAAGVAAGLVTVILDVLKGAAAVWLARWVAPGNPWLEVLAPILAVIGHNYSIYLLEKTSHNRLRLRGGAGGAPCVGGLFGLWPPILLIVLPLLFLIWYFVGYASVTTMSAAILGAVIFAVRASQGLSPWEYVAYGLLSELVLIWALRPNIQRLINGTERVVGWRARKIKQAPQG